MPGSETADVAVIGLGAMGAATLYQLALQGIRAIGIDRFRPPHSLGSSHGETRITRCAVGEGDAYVPLVTRSQAIWRELEGRTGEHLFEQAGCLVMSARGAASLHHGRPDFMQRTADVADRFAIPHELLRADEIEYRFPQFQCRQDERGCFEPGGGFLFPERCIDTQLRLAEHFGAELRPDELVTAVTEDHGVVRITTDRSTIEARHVIVAAGAWTAKLLGSPYADRLRVTRQVLHWFDTDNAAFGADRSPVYIWMHGPSTEDFFYGFPSVAGSGQIKVATEQEEVTTDPDKVDREVAADETATMYDRHVAPNLRGVARTGARSKVCLYTSTATADFWIDRHPAFEHVTVVSACSGHGFKHSAAIGEALAQQIATGTTPTSLQPFAGPS